MEIFQYLPEFQLPTLESIPDEIDSWVSQPENVSSIVRDFVGHIGEEPSFQLNSAQFSGDILESTYVQETYGKKNIFTFYDNRRKIVKKKNYYYFFF